MRGKPCGMHPSHLMGKRSSPCGRTDKAVVVEDHGNGYMFVGTTDIDQAKRLVAEYVDNPEEYVFAARTWSHEDRSHRVWLSVEPLAAWDGARDPMGNLLPR